MKRQRIKLCCFTLWLALVLLLEWHHAFWRDEVRALSLALQGSTLAGMLKGIHGEGHPALWYLMLRGAYAAIGSVLALPIVAIAVAAAAMLLLVRASPFGICIVALILFGDVALFEYAVMARNYGITMLLLFLLAACYERHRRRGWVLGLLLLLLANTNAHSVLLVGAFLLFWLIDLIDAEGLRWTARWRVFFVNAAIAAIGIVLCVITIYPPVNDAVTVDRGQLSLPVIAKHLLLPAIPFSELVISLPWRALGLAPLTRAPLLLQQALMSMLMIASLLGLVRLPGALVAALAALIGFELFFVLIYHGFYRHEALWLIFLITLYWIALAREGRAPPVSYRSGPLARLQRAGMLALVALLVLQVPGSVAAIADAALDRAPLSRSRDLADLIRSDPDLRRAIIIGDPEYMLEPLPYYVPNRLYFLREQRFGRVVTFTRHAQRRLCLDDFLAAARRLNIESGAPVVIVMMHELDPKAPAREIQEGYDWQLLTSPAQVARFLGATRLLAHLRPARSDESYDVYAYDAINRG